VPRRPARGGSRQAFNPARSQPVFGLRGYWTRSPNRLIASAVLSSAPEDSSCNPKCTNRLGNSVSAVSTRLIIWSASRFRYPGEVSFHQSSIIFSCSGGRSGRFSSGRGYFCKGGRSGSSVIFPGSSASTSSNVSASCQSSSTGAAVGSGASAIGGGAIGIRWSFGRQHFLYFLPLPQGQGSLRPAFIVLSFPHLQRAGNRNLDPITCLMASDESNFSCKAASRNASSRRPRRP
jgi:hypothetical protein